MQAAFADVRRRSFRVRLGLVLALAVVAVALLYAQPPLPQDPDYHAFADQRTLLCVPHCHNVLSNLPFVLVGVFGVWFLASEPGRRSFQDRSERTAYLSFFIGIGLTGLGSAYYHLDPTNDRLVWDRLPMTIAFMSLFAALLGERLGVAVGRRLLVPLLVLGLASVVYWHATERAGAGDLRPYYLVQFYPMVAIPLLLLLFPPRYTGSTALLIALGLYVLAKVTEVYDGAIFHVVGFVSGHALKHLLAALGAYVILVMLQRRKIASFDQAVAGSGSK